MEQNQMSSNKRKNCKGQRKVERKEAIERGIRNPETAPNSLNKRKANKRNG